MRECAAAAQRVKRDMKLVRASHSKVYGEKGKQKINNFFFIFAQRHNNLLHTLIYHRSAKQWHRKTDLGAHTYTSYLVFVSIFVVKPK